MLLLVADSEDALSDYLDVKADVALVTAEVARTVPAVRRLHKILVLSDGMTKDASFARQLRKKFAA